MSQRPMTQALLRSAFLCGSPIEASEACLLALPEAALVREWKRRGISRLAPLAAGTHLRHSF